MQLLSGLGITSLALNKACYCLSASSLDSWKLMLQTQQKNKIGRNKWEPVPHVWPQQSPWQQFLQQDCRAAQHHSAFQGWRNVIYYRLLVPSPMYFLSTSVQLQLLLWITSSAFFFFFSPIITIQRQMQHQLAVTGMISADIWIQHKHCALLHLSFNMTWSHNNLLSLAFE